MPLHFLQMSDRIGNDVITCFVQTKIPDRGIASSAQSLDQHFTENCVYKELVELHAGIFTCVDG